MGIIAGSLLRLPAITHNYGGGSPSAGGGYAYSADAFDWEGYVIRPSSSINPMPIFTNGSQDSPVFVPEFTTDGGGRSIAGVIATFGQENSDAEDDYTLRVGSLVPIATGTGGSSNTDVSHTVTGYAFSATAGRFVCGKGLIVLDWRELISRLALNYGASPPAPFTFLGTGNVINGTYAGIPWEGDVIDTGDPAALGFEGDALATVPFTNISTPDAAFMVTLAGYFDSLRIVAIAPDNFDASADIDTTTDGGMAVWNGLKGDIETAHVALATSLAASMGAELEFIDAADYSADYDARVLELIDEL